MRNTRLFNRILNSGGLAGRAHDEDLRRADAHIQERPDRGPLDLAQLHLLPPTSESQPEPQPEPEPEPEPEIGAGPVLSLGDVARSMGLSVVEHPEQTLETRATVTPALVAESADVVTEAMQLRVTDPASCTRGEELYDLLRRFEAAAGEFYDTDCDRAHKLWKSLTDKRGAVLKPILAAKKYVGDVVATWKVAMQQREQAEQVARERQAQAEQTASFERSAKQAIAAGDVETAASILADARTAPAPIVPRQPSAAPSTGKTSTRTKWVASCANLDAFITALATQRDATGKRLMTEFDGAILEAVQASMNRMATTLQGELGKRYPGWEGKQSSGLAGR